LSTVSIILIPCYVNRYVI